MQKIRVCADPFPPYQYRTADGQPAGSDYERVIRRLQAAGFAPEMTIAPWAAVYAAFENGEQEVLFQVQDTPERLAKYYLSRRLRDAVTEIVTANPKHCDIKSVEQLAGSTLGVIDGFANGPEIDALSEAGKIPFVGTQELLTAVLSGQVTYGVCDRGVRQFLLPTAPLYPVLTYSRPLYVMFRDRKIRDAYDLACSKMSD